MAEFFSKLSKRQRNAVEHFKTQSGRGGILLYHLVSKNAWDNHKSNRLFACEIEEPTQSTVVEADPPADAVEEPAEPQKQVKTYGMILAPLKTLTKLTGFIFNPEN